MEISEQCLALLRIGGLSIEIEAVVLGVRRFKAADGFVTKVTVAGTPGGPMGQGIECRPYGVFELDADIGVYESLENRLTEPVRIRFHADLKPINSSGGYVVHLISALPQITQQSS